MPRPPHVAYLFSRYPVVSQTFCDTEMLALEARGFRLTVASLNRPPDSFRHERLSRLRAEVIYPPPAGVLDLPLRNPPDDALWRAMAALAEDHDARFGESVKAMTRARNAWHVARALRRRGVEHIHVHFANRATHTALFLRKAGFRFSFTAHAQDFMVDLANDALLREMILEAEFVVAVSDFSRSLLVQVCPEAAGRIVRIYNGIDASAFPVVARGGCASRPPRIVSIGRLIPFKGFDVLMRAVAALWQRGVAAELRIIGDGPQRPELEHLAQELGAGDRIQLPGVRSQEAVIRELSDADVFALACRVDESGASDILPTVILEAMACGLPVVSTALAGVPEMVVHGETGLLAPPDDAETLCDHLAALARDPDARARMGAAGRARVRDVFSLDRTAGCLADRFRTVAGSGALPDPEAAEVLCLTAAWPAQDDRLQEELEFLAGEPRCQVVAAGAGRGGMPPDRVEFLPDAVVLEAAWRSAPAQVAAVEAMRAATGSLDGELFYREARRAVYLAGEAGKRGWRRVHAVRASGVLCAWLITRLTGIQATATVEANHAWSRTLLSRLLQDFAFGSVSDERISVRGGRFGDVMRLLPPPAGRRFPGLPKRRDPAPDVRAIWQRWLREPFASGDAEPEIPSAGS